MTTTGASSESRVWYVGLSPNCLFEPALDHLRNPLTDEGGVRLTAENTFTVFPESSDPTKSIEARMADYWYPDTNPTPPTGVDIDSSDIRLFFTQNFEVLKLADHVINSASVPGYTHNYTEALWLEVRQHPNQNNTGRASQASLLCRIKNGYLSYQQAYQFVHDKELLVNPPERNLDALALYVIGQSSRQP
jgi:hypothetical protein